MYLTAAIGAGCSASRVDTAAERASRENEVADQAAPIEDLPPEVVYVGGDPEGGTSAAVVVQGFALAHTTQLLPLDAQGQLVGEGSVDTQLDQILSRLDAALTAAGSRSDQLVKLAFYVDGPETAAAVQGLLVQRFPGPAKPAVTWAASALPVAGALVAVDAVALVPGEGPDTAQRLSVDGLAGPAAAAHVAILPRGGAVYLSGHPERGEPAPAAEKSLAVLIDMLDQMGLTADDVVHVRAFLQPMEQASVVTEAIAKAFAGQTTPPVTLVEWTSPAPVEIEMIASAPTLSAAGETVAYFTPAGVKPNPRFSRAARVQGGKTVYLGSLQAREPGSGEQQVRDVFVTLEEVLKLADSDLRHLVKATYYCADEESSQALDKIRSELFDPVRPPAASKVMVTRLPFAERSMVMDMIAVTPREP